MSTTLPVPDTLPALRADFARQSLSIPAEALTLQGFQRWATSERFPEGCRISWIRGEVLIDMSPEEIESHSKLKTELGRVVATFVKGRRLGEVYIDRMLITHEEAELSTEPDVMFIAHESFVERRAEKVRSREGRYVSIAGSPDLVVEIVSQSSVLKDTKLLKEAYEAAGVREYWLIDAQRSDMQIQVFALEAGKFQSLAVNDGRWHSPLFQASFHLWREKDPFGYWEYTLDFANEQA